MRVGPGTAFSSPAFQALAHRKLPNAAISTPANSFNRVCTTVLLRASLTTAGGSTLAPTTCNTRPIQ